MPGPLTGRTAVITGASRGIGAACARALSGLGVFVVAVAIGLGSFLVPESRDPKSTPLDPVGAGLSIVALVALVYAIIEAPSEGWTDPLVLAAFGVAAVLIVVEFLH